MYSEPPLPFSFSAVQLVFVAATQILQLQLRFHLISQTQTKTGRKAKGFCQRIFTVRLTYILITLKAQYANRQQTQTQITSCKNRLILVLKCECLNLCVLWRRRVQDPTPGPKLLHVAQTSDLRELVIHHIQRE